MSNQTTAIILAGGKSTRLGRDKASELLLSRPMLQHVIDRLVDTVDRLIVVKAAGQTLPPIEAPSLLVVEDAHDDAGPVGGIYSGLLACEGSHAFVAACDMPLLEPALVQEILRLAPGYDVVVPVGADGQLQPLCAVYATAIVSKLGMRLDAGRLRLTEALDDMTTLYLQPEAWQPFDADGLSFMNLNREEDLRRAEALLAAQR